LIDGQASTSTRPRRALPGRAIIRIRLRY